jgi:hypothetical protein
MSDPESRERDARGVEELSDAIEEAVMEAQGTYESANKSPLDHGHAFIKGLDGRTRLASALQSHPQVHVEKGGYHGTTVHLQGVSRYLSAQRGAYDVFIKTLESLGVDTQDMRIWARAD